MSLYNLLYELLPKDIVDYVIIDYLLPEIPCQKVEMYYLGTQIKALYGVFQPYIFDKVIPSYDHAKTRQDIRNSYNPNRDHISWFDLKYERCKYGHYVVLSDDRYPCYDDDEDTKLYIYDKHQVETRVQEFIQRHKIKNI